MLDELMKLYISVGDYQMKISDIEYVKSDIKLFYNFKFAKNRFQDNRFQDTFSRDSVLSSDLLKDWNRTTTKKDKDTIIFYDLLEIALKEHRRNEKLEMILKHKKISDVR